MEKVNRKYDLEFKNKVISEMFKNNYSIRYTAKLFDIKIATISTWLYRTKNKEIRKEVIKTKKEALIMVKKALEANPRPLIKDLLKQYNLTRSYWLKYKNVDLKFDKDFEIYEKIKKIFDNNLCQFGYRRIREYYIKMYNTKISASKILRIMKKYGIISKFQIRAQINATRNRAREKTNFKYRDLIKRKYDSIKESNRVWYTDVTYLISTNGKLYVSTIIDAYSKKVIDYKISDKNNIDLVIKNLKSSIYKTKRKGLFNENIIIHSDRGNQYISREYAEMTNKNNIIVSMGRSGVCYDNVVIESFHSLLKKGTIHNNVLCKKDINIYRRSVVQWYAWYNNYKKRSNLSLQIKL